MTLSSQDYRDYVELSGNIERLKHLAVAIDMVGYKYTLPTKEQLLKLNEEIGAVCAAAADANHRLVKIITKPQEEQNGNK